ncbi:acyl carrier protein [Marinobacter changyiensis]|uniref:acyl carrier protein n=1 Tax=Marinobacter changyiensis TaxID=2604091 RepID=UPI001263F50A|nr:acyl carrier protein [Marinobacter changyiensis]
MNIEDLKIELKELIIDECDVDVEAGEIQDNEFLIGPESRLNLDSLDALSISLEVKRRFGKHIDSGNETRLALTSVEKLAAFIVAD